MDILKSFRRAQFKACNNYQNLVSWSIVVKDPNQGLKKALVSFFLRVPQSAEQVKILIFLVKVSKGANIRNRYNQIPHLAQDTNGKVRNSQLDTTNGSQEVSPFPAGDHKAHINRRIQMHSKHKTEKHKRSTKEVLPRNSQ